jgi:hypothetical protein
MNLGRTWCWRSVWQRLFISGRQQVERGREEEKERE